MILCLERLHAVIHVIHNLITELTLILLSDVLKAQDNVYHGFKSGHIITGSNQLFIMLSIMFNTMLTPGVNQEDLLLFTINFISNNNRGSMNSSDINTSVVLLRAKLFGVC